MGRLAYIIIAVDNNWVFILFQVLGNVVYVWKWKVKVAQSSPTLCDPVVYTVHGILQARILEYSGYTGQPFPFPGDLPNPGIEPRSPALQTDYLPAEPQGKPKNTGVGSQSLLQRIFLTQESNQDLLHCRQILTNWVIREAQNLCVYLIKPCTFLWGKNFIAPFHRWDNWGTERLRNLVNVIFKGPGRSKMPWF